MRVRFWYRLSTPTRVESILSGLLSSHILPPLLYCARFRNNDIIMLLQSDLLARARALYSALDLRLGKQDAYFFGATPTSLDACVFGHLAEAWSVGDLLDLLPAFENLSRCVSVCVCGRGCHEPLPLPAGSCSSNW